MSSPPPPPPTPEQVLAACATAPLPSILALLAACPSPPTDYQIAAAAVEHDRADIITHLLSTGSPIHCVCRRDVVDKRSIPILEALLAAGWDINSDLGSYRGCALAAAMQGRAPPDFVAWLLDGCGADPNGPYGGVDHLGHPLRMAVQFAPEDEGVGDDAAAAAPPPPGAMGRMLLERGARVDESRALHAAAEQGRLGWVRCLVEEWGADVDAEWFPEDWAGSTEVGLGIGRPLHYAAREGHAAVVRYLVGKGADVRRRDTKGRTPREVAEHFGHGEAAAFLRALEEDQGGSSEAE
ncbi:uncharacterized protein BKCO1_3000057 [Diplodia corticola]|uniref:Uncharacterized protein n=1 Tax=Diplodia corticola TaxID=236234 RepID=A0A1J9QZL2_9PEZI|nr:uncharacterized protein BKCO1_3000057 [Diplodia corticola]OJD33426.1 hypothetical protein BKCO1_3000057 [Diplodia corticola]